MQISLKFGYIYKIKCQFDLFSLQEKPKAAEWRNKPILHYEKLAILFGKDRATREHAQIAAEIRARKVVGKNGQDNTIDEIDHLVSPIK